ncbi:MAG: alpha/beta hydrolase [Proteobacteria bacterium]|nr:alpha/beta hydrolase [Pseudomonadota bacterium]
MKKHRYLLLRDRVFPVALFILMATGTAAPSFAQTAMSPYVSPGTPQGTGPHPAIMEADPGLATHTIYRPKNMAALGNQKLPILVFANGACANRGNSFRYFLSEIASHGVLAIAIGPIGPKEGEYEHIGNGEPASGSPAAALAAAGKLAAATPGSGPTPAYTTASQLSEAIDWAQAENLRHGRPYYGKLDPARIAVMGMSCGGLQALDTAHDPRVTTLGVWNSGTYNDDKRAMEIAAAKATKAGLKTLRIPTIYVTGDPSDVAFANTEDDFARIDGAPLFRAWREMTGHGGTYREPNGGEFGRVAVAWLLWQLKGDKEAAKMFIGADCGICKLPNWHVKKKNID